MLQNVPLYMYLCAGMLFAQADIKFLNLRSEVWVYVGHIATIQQ